MKGTKGGKKTSVPSIHVCVHSLRDNGCLPGDIEIASVRLTYLSVHEEARRVRGSLLGRVKHKSISLYSTASREEATTTASSILNGRGRWTAKRLYRRFCLHCSEIFTPVCHTKGYL